MSRSRDFFNCRRLEMMPEQTGVPSLLMLGRYNHLSARAGLSRHAHSGAIEICFLVKGRQTYEVNGHQYQLRGGDVFFTRPNEMHSTGRLPEEKGVLYWLILRVPRGRQAFLGLPPTQGRALINELLHLRSRHFRGVWSMKTLLDECMVACHDLRSPLRETLIANRICAFLLHMVAGGQKVLGLDSSVSLHNIVEYIAQHLTETLTIRDLAAQAGLSVSRFKIRFKAELGVPPAEFILRAKIEEAQHRLARGGQTVTEIAYALGFPSSQYFATVFKRFTGQHPSAQLPRKKIRR